MQPAVEDVDNTAVVTLVRHLPVVPIKRPRIGTEMVNDALSIPS